MINVGLIGLGWVGRNRHIPTIKRNKKFNLVGIADKNPEKIDFCAKRFGIEKTSKSLKINDISWINDVDAVDIATSPMEHYPLIKEALLMGKHVITEKPFTLSVKQGEELCELAHTYQKQLCIVHNFQFASSMKKLIQDINSGKIGNVKNIVISCLSNPKRRLPTWHEELPLGLFFDESPHFFYILKKLAGEIPVPHHISVFPSTLGKKTPSSVQALYRTNSGIGITLNIFFEAALSEWHVTVLGEKSTGIVDLFRDIYVRLVNDQSHSALDIARTSLSSLIQNSHQYLINGLFHVSGRLLYGNDQVFDLFADSILTSTPAKHISADDALNVLKMQHEIINSIKNVNER